MKTRLAALMLAFAAPAVVQAAPITMSGANFDGAFSLQGQFQLVQSQVLSGRIEAVSRQSTDLGIEALVLTQGQRVLRFDLVQDGTHFAALPSTTRTVSVKGKDVTEWVQAFNISPVELEAGEWSMALIGQDTNQKTPSSVSLRLEPSNNVPEPSSLAAVLAAFAGLGALSRRRANASR